jgi:hypothetical protein
VGADEQVRRSYDEACAQLEAARTALHQLRFPLPPLPAGLLVVFTVCLWRFLLLLLWLVSCGCGLCCRAPGRRVSRAASSSRNPRQRFSFPRTSATRQGSHCRALCLCGLTPFANVLLFRNFKALLTALTVFLVVLAVCVCVCPFWRSPRHRSQLSCVAQYPPPP